MQHMEQMEQTKRRLQQSQTADRAVIYEKLTRTFLYSQDNIFHINGK